MRGGRMTIKTLFKKLDRVYHADGSIRIEEGYGDGDTLALFIANEVKSLVRVDLPIRSQELGELCNAFDRAMSELGDVTCELHAIHSMQVEKERKK
jgi:hypothetical protein